MGVLTESVSFNHTDLRIQAACTSGWIWVPAWTWTDCKIGCEFRVGCEMNANLKSRWMVFGHLSLCVSRLSFLHHFRWAQGMSISPISLAHKCCYFWTPNFMFCVIIASRVPLCFIFQGGSSMLASCHHRGTKIKVCIFSSALTLLNNNPNPLGML